MSGAVAGAALGALLAVTTAGALAWKWQLGVTRAALVTALPALAAGAAAALTAPSAAVAAAATWTATLAVAAALLAHRFYRDPERRAPDRDDVVVSPADGEVLYVRASAGGRIPASSKLARDYALEELTRTPLHAGDALVVGIGLSFLDVHVNRAPLRGRVALERHHPGRFASLRRPEALLENERATLVIERDGLEVAVVLIASRLVRRIVTYVREGQALALGQRIGAIRFGSQVDVVVPRRPGIALAVAPGDRVVAGETILAVIGDA